MATVLYLEKDEELKLTFNDPVKKAYSEYKNFYHYSRLLVESKDVGEILSGLILLLGEIVDFSALGLLLKEEFSDDFYLHHEYKLSNRLADRIRWLERSGYFQWVCDEERVSIIPNENQQEDNFSNVLVPLLSGRQAVGVLVIFLKLRPQELTSRLSDLLFLLGTQAAVALKNVFLYQDMALKNQAMTSMKSFLENSLESMADGLFTIDFENKISLFNTSAAKYLGVSAVQAIGNDIHRVFAPEFAAFLEHSLKTTYTVGYFEGEFDFQPANTGKHFPLGIRLSILKNFQNEQIGAIAICRDLSERQELIHLRKLDQLKDEFISAVSHELRTPLTGIKSFTEILLQYDDQDAETQKEFLKIIEKETNRLIEIVNDLLDLSKLNQQNFEVNAEPLNIQEVLNESLRLLQILAESKNIQIVPELDSNHLMVVGDFNRLIQVFVNLISNAIKFSHENSKVRIWSKPIKGKRLMDSGNYLQIAVEDNGVGIPKPYHKIIFERFKQFSFDAATKPDGNGLGLSICQKIIEKQNGNIWVESEVNVGSSFYFTLPMSVAGQAEVVNE